MPRGNINNLVKNSDLTPEERKKKRSKAGKASVQKRREQKTIKEYLNLLLNSEIASTDGSKRLGAEAMAIIAFRNALEGDWKAWELVRDTSGQKPIEKVEIAEIDKEIIDEVERFMESEEQE